MILRYLKHLHNMTDNVDDCVAQEKVKGLNVTASWLDANRTWY